MSARDDIPAAERLSDKLMAGLRPEPPIDTTLFISAERQKEMAFRATLPYCGREDVEEIIREAITETARVIKRHLASRPAQHEADRDRAAEEAKAVCHDEQMTVWTHEIAGQLSMAGYLREGLSYEDVIDIHRRLAAEVQSIVASAFGHPELGVGSAAEEERIREDERDRLYAVASHISKGKVAGTTCHEQSEATTVAYWLMGQGAEHPRYRQDARTALRSSPHKGGTENG